MLQADASLSDQVDAVIQSNPYLIGKHLRFETQDGHVVLHGRVSTYFQKQMAQEAVRRIAGVRRVDNQLEVTWATVAH